MIDPQHFRLEFWWFVEGKAFQDDQPVSSLGTHLNTK